MALQALVVEDDIASLELIREVLVSMNAKVEAFSESWQAVPRLEQKRFDGIFLDLTMPGPNGFELCRMVRSSSRNKKTPIIIVTGREEKETMGQAFSLGGSFYLQKPIDRYKLIKLFHTTQGAMQENRRQFARISMRTEVSCEAKTLSIKGDSANLSSAGILFDAGGALKPKERVSLTFTLPAQREPIQVEGVVARVDEKGRAGVQFIVISPRDKQRIRQLVDQELAA
jgi:CheY-like chemotaxis protein